MSSTQCTPFTSEPVLFATTQKVCHGPDALLRKSMHTRFFPAGALASYTLAEASPERDRCEEGSSFHGFINWLWRRVVEVLSS